MQMPKPIFPEDLGSPRTLRTILRESFEGRIVGIGVNIIRSFINLVIKFSHHSICPTKIYREYIDPRVMGSSSRRETTLVETTRSDYAHSSICITVIMHAWRDSRRAKYSLLSLTNWLAGRSVGLRGRQHDNSCH